MGDLVHGRSFTFVDLFAGLGGFHQAAASLGGECVFACEISEKLQDLYFKNFGIRPAGDIRNIEPNSIPNMMFYLRVFLASHFLRQESNSAGRMRFEALCSVTSLIS